MLVFKKEKKVMKLVLAHLEKVEACVERVGNVVEHYILGDLTEAERAWQEVNDLESEADSIRREILETLYSGAYLPLIREDIYKVVECIDRVANAGEDCCDHFLAQRPHIPEELKPAFAGLCRGSIAIIKPLHAATTAYFKPKGKIQSVREHAQEVGRQESAVDSEESALTMKVFTSDLELAEKLHLRSCIAHIVEIADRAEDASDQLELVSLKSIV